tara:strand:- start:656 stop:895 length:240 start_codon:yes stop_codon:yes gene_type:complete
LKDREIIEVIQNIFRDILNNRDLLVSNESKPSDIEGWDSLANINIIVALEEQFKIKLGLDEITNVNSVKDLVSIVKNHL